MIDKNAYTPLLEEITETIKIARINASKAINFSAIQLNYDIGRRIVQKQEQFGWGKSIVEKLSKDLKRIFNGIDGYSAQNLWLMRQFYLAYKEKNDLLELARQVPWGQNILIIQKEKDDDVRKFYLQSTIESAWSRSFLLIQIKSKAYKYYKLEPKQSNFEKALTIQQSEQAEESLKSVYNLDFLG
jgi:predicted nuclease of restriction endonuclease-like (RecB) superfamily